MPPKSTLAACIQFHPEVCFILRLDWIMNSMVKKALIGVVVSCLVIASIITYFSKGQATGVESIKSGTLVWVKCFSEKCKAEYELEKRDFYAQVQEKRKLKLMSMMNVPIDCQKCGSESLKLAEKCGKCGHVFFKASVSGKYGDQCPKCGYSAIKEKVSERAK